MRIVTGGIAAAAVAAAAVMAGAAARRDAAIHIRAGPHPRGRRADGRTGRLRRLVSTDSLSGRRRAPRRRRLHRSRRARVPRGRSGPPGARPRGHDGRFRVVSARLGTLAARLEHRSPTGTESPDLPPRCGAQQPVTDDAAATAGDLVTRCCWQRPHIGLVTDQRSPDGSAPPSRITSGAVLRSKTCCCLPGDGALPIRGVSDGRNNAGRGRIRRPW